MKIEIMMNKDRLSVAVLILYSYVSFTLCGRIGTFIFSLPSITDFVLVCTCIYSSKRKTTKCEEYVTVFMLMAIWESGGVVSRHADGGLAGPAMLILPACLKTRYENAVKLKPKRLFLP